MRFRIPRSMNWKQFVDQVAIKLLGAPSDLDDTVDPSSWKLVLCSLWRPQEQPPGKFSIWPSQAFTGLGGSKRKVSSSRSADRTIHMENPLYKCFQFVWVNKIYLQDRNCLWIPRRKNLATRSRYAIAAILNNSGIPTYSFGDDCLTLIVSTCISIISDVMQSVLQVAKGWCHPYGFSVNPSKTLLAKPWWSVMSTLMSLGYISLTHLLDSIVFSCQHICSVLQKHLIYICFDS